jgi:hypothetical protein
MTVALPSVAFPATDALAEKLADALERERTLRAAVEWYADRSNYEARVVRDGGARARAAIRNAPRPNAPRPNAPRRP